MYVTRKRYDELAKTLNEKELSLFQIPEKKYTASFHYTKTPYTISVMSVTDLSRSCELIDVGVEQYIYSLDSGNKYGTHFMILEVEDFETAKNIVQSFSDCY